ncbi:hypothetical protein M3936_19180 [Sutcliffiella horikoshii]|uniref:hypothetical protein n=1 Tax=Sutcliffiella horikoshii TaxID=79883 RepID=UPI00203E3B0C|nr:hypothetical protein [Sutcliffiella horikoshii]MCM3619696.1 hypothetical protein [Sutcliffiella horikoshii]
MDLNYLHKLRQHRVKLTSRSEWDQYAKIHGLPSSYYLIKSVGSWRKVKEQLGVSTRRRVTLNQDEMKRLLHEHSNYLTTALEWDEYALKEDLPSSRTIINHFSSWKQAQESIGVKTTPRPAPKSYQKDEIISLLKEHPNSYLNQLNWNEYAKKNSLPSYKTIRKHLTFEEFINLTGKSHN